MTDERGSHDLARVIRQPEFLRAHAELVTEMEAYIQQAVAAVGDDEQEIQKWLMTKMETDTELRGLITRMDAERYILDRLEQEGPDR